MRIQWTKKLSILIEQPGLFRTQRGMLMSKKVELDLSGVTHFSIPNYILYMESPKFSFWEKALLSRIAWFTVNGEERMCFESNERLARLFGKNKDTIRGAIRKLHRQRLIERNYMNGQRRMLVTDNRILGAIRNERRFSRPRTSDRIAL